MLKQAHSNLYFVYVLTIFQSIHKCFDTLVKILKHTHNIFTTALIMSFISHFTNSSFIRKTYKNRINFLLSYISSSKSDNLVYT